MVSWWAKGVSNAGRSNAGQSNTLTWKGSKRQREANKSNRSARGKADSPTQDARKRARDWMSIMTLPDNQEFEAMAWCEKESGEHERVAIKSNRSTRGRVNSLIQEASELATDSQTGTEIRRSRLICKHNVVKQPRGKSNNLTWEGSKRVWDSSN